jgi:hypothetical protein
MIEFPEPFDAIEKTITLEPFQAALVMEWFERRCYDDHVHNFAIEMELNGNTTFHVSSMAAKCIKKLLKEVEH